MRHNRVFNYIPSTLFEIALRRPIQLDAIWLDIGREIEVFSTGRFDRVAAGPGIYAWFYPYRLTNDKKRSEFIAEIDYINEFDPKQEGGFRMTAEIERAWDTYFVELAKRTRRIMAENTKFEEIWLAIKENPDSLYEFRKELYKSSILGRPLYVGKAANLHTRIQTHLKGGRNDESSFARRFLAHLEAAARHSIQLKFGAKKIEDLLLVTIKTEYVVVKERPMHDRPEDLMEYILKSATKPHSACYDS
jgi:hypothetical protein